jgi:hypothetical protein
MSRPTWAPGDGSSREGAGGLHHQRTMHRTSSPELGVFVQQSIDAKRRRRCGSATRAHVYDESASFEGATRRRRQRAIGPRASFPTERRSRVHGAAVTCSRRRRSRSGAEVRERAAQGDPPRRPTRRTTRDRRRAACKVTPARRPHLASISLAARSRTASVQALARCEHAMISRSIHAGTSVASVRADCIRCCA